MSSIWRTVSAAPRRLTTAESDRAAGVLLDMSCDAALGAGWEFGPPIGPGVKPPELGVG